MAVRSTSRPSAAGLRLPYEQVPDRVRAWVDQQLGSHVTTAVTQQGGMSPGCAARLRTGDGRTAFVKAVGADLNPQTPDLFRHEIQVLSALRPAEYRPEVLGHHDDGDWVALLLEDVDGHHPDLNDPEQADAVWSAVATQSTELTPPPAGPAVTTLADNARRWASGWATVAADPVRFLPDWAAARADELHRRATALADRLPVESLCHWDVRNDNLLIRPDGTAVIVDWGMSRLGPSWADLFLLSVAWADRPEFDARAATFGADPATVTDLLIGLGGWLAFRSTRDAPPGLPTMPAFQRREARRMLAAARRRLDKEPL